MRSIVELDELIGIVARDVMSEQGRMSVWGKSDLSPTGMTVSRSNIHLLLKSYISVRWFLQSSGL
jgi:hypothetical protein